MSSEVKKIDEVTLARAWIEWLVETRTGYMDTLFLLPESDRLKDRGASFPSIQDIFLHIIDNNIWWFESVPQNHQETHTEIKGRISESQIRKHISRIAEVSRQLAESLTAEKLNESYVIRGVAGNGKPFEMKVNLRTIIWHMVEEELQHRGEMNALFWQMDVDAPTRAWFSSNLAE
ncbi:MAG: DUF664 domain-containing protein [Thermoplasmata archaeon]|nr:DUF664 domain-containing protein [Candidatus Sysuiplasma acidicola]MBX8645689.1 DUF664 domain-containing protein [Candidatus Sysuiplasma acidicola]